MRHHIVNGKKILFTPEEETAADAREAAYAPPPPPPDPDADLEIDLANVAPLIQAVTDSKTRAALQGLHDAITGNGPNQAKVRGRK